MKRIFSVIAGLLMLTTINAQSTHSVKNNLEMEGSIREMKDKTALKELVDRFSILADVKDIDNQLLLFTEDAVVASTANGRTSTLTGRKQIGDAFSAYLSLFDIVYHINGQQTVTLAGDTATGISYCQVILIGNQDGKRLIHTRYVIYNDTYRKINGTWYIAHRKSDFVWDKVEEVK